MKNILYISYDGMTDPLGQSQVIPYLQGLSKHGYRFTILSFEKKDKFKRLESSIRNSLKPFGIEWVPMSFTTSPPVLSKIYDVYQMRRMAFKLQRRNKYDMIHCRSYISANVGMELKRKFGVKFFFDMRGFWPDEKKDAGAWNQLNPFFRYIYQQYKKKETRYIQTADQVISLTEAGKREMMNWPCWHEGIKIGVIPCCADMDLFSVTDATQKATSRELLQLPEKSLIVSYLGSLGSWYMLDEMLQLFSFIKKAYPSAVFLFVTNSEPEIILQKAGVYGFKECDFRIIRADRNEVPVYIKASDINISFIKPVYSKLSSSPTKLGEVLAMGIPVICNAGVGDVEQQVLQADAGLVIKSFTELEFKNVVKDIPLLLHKSPNVIRNNVKEVFDLERGVEKYKTFYESVFNA